MLWRLGWNRSLCESFQNSEAQATATGRFVKQKNTFCTQSIAALDIFMLFFREQRHCRSPPIPIEKSGINKFQSEERQCNSL